MKNEVVTLSAGTRVYFVRTPQDIEAERLRDIASGHTMTCDGETILYSSIASATLPRDTSITITKKSKVEWPTWTKKPKRLTEGLLADAVTDSVGQSRWVVLFCRRV